MRDFTFSRGLPRKRSKGREEAEGTVGQSLRKSQRCQETNQTRNGRNCAVGKIYMNMNISNMSDLNCERQQQQALFA